jgi:hypothetical protein
MHLCCDVRYNFHIQTIFGVRLYLQLFVGGLMSYLRYLCLFANSGVQHILCCVFALFVLVLLPFFSGLSIFDCLFDIL